MTNAPEPQTSPTARNTLRRLTRRLKGLLTRLDRRTRRLTAWWNKQQFLKFFLGAVAIVVATIGIPTTILPLWQYYAEADEREAERRLKRLEVLGTAWDRIKDSPGKIGDVGQVGAVAILLSDNSAVFRHSHLSGIDFTRADFSGADLTFAIFADGRFIESRFVGATIGKLTFQNARLADVDLSRTQVYGSRLDLSNTRLRNVTLPADASTTILDIRRATVASIDLGAFKRERIVADGVCIVTVDFSEYQPPPDPTPLMKSLIPTKTQRALSFCNARLAGVSFLNADLSNADFRRALVTSARRYNNLHFVHFSRWAKAVDPECQHANEIVIDTEAILPGSDPSNVEASEEAYTPLIGGASSNGNRRIRWHNTDFEGARMQDTRLEGADLREAANLTQAQIDVACLDQSTRLPENLTWNGRICPLADQGRASHAC